MESYLPLQHEVPEHMVPLLDYFEKRIVLDIATLFDTPNEYWEAMGEWRSRALHNGEYDPRIDSLLELQSKEPGQE